VLTIVYYVPKPMHWPAWTDEFFLDRGLSIRGPHTRVTPTQAEEKSNECRHAKYEERCPARRRGRRTGLRV
jgi:hypothetical protein